MRNPSHSSSSETVEGRTKGCRIPTPCCSKVGLKRGPWTQEEDLILSNFINKEGEGRWRTLPKRAGLQRCGKSCRLRWMNYLRPSIKHGPIDGDEEDIILRLHRLLGNRWSLIAGRIPGRTDNEIKNYWNTHLSKKLISQGIDPRTHKPFTTNLDPGEARDKKKYTSQGLQMRNNNSSVLSPPVNSQVVRGEDEVIPDQNIHCNYFDGLEQNNESAMLENYGGISLECGTNDAFSSFLDSLISDEFELQQNIGCSIHANGKNIAENADNNHVVGATSSSFEGYHDLGGVWDGCFQGELDGDADK